MAKRACPQGRVLCEYQAPRLGIESGVGKGLSTWGALSRGSETKLVSFMTLARDKSPVDSFCWLLPNVSFL